MNNRFKVINILLFLIFVMFFVSCSGVINIAYIIKDPNESWFQDEIKYAKQASDELGFKLIIYPDNGNTRVDKYKIENVMLDLIDAANKGVDGVVICIPDVNEGQMVLDFCNNNDIKLLTVDDRFVDLNSSSDFIESVHHIGIDSYLIGRLVGISLGQYMIDRELTSSEVGIIELWDPSAIDIMERVIGTSMLLKEVLPFKNSNFFRLNLANPSIDVAYNTVFYNFKSFSAKFDNWIIIGQNDDCVIGGVRALADLDVESKNILSFGINCSSLAVEELKKDDNGFLGSVKLDVKRHGYGSVEMMYKWIKFKEEPPLLTFTTGTLFTSDDLE